VITLTSRQDKDAAKVKKKEQKTPEYQFFVEFQSHEPEFDYLKSLEIEEKINKIKWLNRNSNGHFLLTTNGAYWILGSRLPSLVCSFLFMCR
jgi:hypothetical protein